MGVIPDSAKPKEFRLPRALEILLGIVVVLELVAPFVSRSYGVDGPEMVRLEGQFSALFAHGIFLPRWVPDAYFGFGEPTFAFYPPVAFYPGAIIRAITGISNPVILFQITSLIATIASFYSARTLIRYLGGNRYQATLAALLYAFGPYRIAELYNRGGITSHFGYCFVPMLWYGIIATCSVRSREWQKGIVVLAIAFAFVALSNIPLMLITLFSVAIAAIIFRQALTWSKVRHVAAGIIVGGLLTAFHFSSVFTYLGETHTENLRGTPQNLLMTFIHGMNVPTAYHVGLMYISMIVLAFVYWKNRRHDILSMLELKILQLGIVVAMVIVILETPFLDKILWSSSIILPFTVGPERYYILILLVVVFIIGIAQSQPVIRTGRIVASILIVGSIVPITLVVLNLHVFKHFEIVGSAPDPAEYLPKGVPQTPVAMNLLQQDTLVISGDFGVDEKILPIQRNAEEEQYRVQFDRPHLITFHRFYWKAWHLSANGIDIPSHADSIGRAEAILPAGNYIALWDYSNTGFEVVGRWISSIALLLLFAVIVRLRFNHVQSA